MRSRHGTAQPELDQLPPSTLPCNLQMAVVPASMAHRTRGRHQQLAGLRLRRRRQQQSKTRPGPFIQVQHQLGVAPNNADLDSEFVITSASPAPGTRDCVRVVHMRARWLTHVRVPLHGEGNGQHVTRPRKSGPYGAVAGMAVVGGCPTTMHDGPATRRIRAVGHNLFIRPMRLRPVTGPGGQTTDRAAPRRSR